MTTRTGSGLPNFTEHEGHAKLESFEDGRYVKPVPFLGNWLVELGAELDRDGENPRILDIGCGRGDTLFWMLDHGWDAWGIDVDERYLEVGRDHLRARGEEPERLKWFDGGPYPFPDEHFDAVISDQVFEHVDDLDALAAEAARVTRDGGRGMHIFPARWRPLEPHLRAPVVHWLPKGRSRRVALQVLLRSHMAASYFADFDLDDRVTIFAEFSDMETFYRPIPEIQATLARNGIAADPIGPSRQKVSRRLPWVPVPGRPAAAWLIRNCATVALETRQVGRPAAA
ncbi:MAG TPA: class I SAM-dependent methyltransferase [Solirubrobacterales bacterium]|jgi:SAM-dependent methyltransferase|nr:class I SAM-dependent methyltransferase [Solirubrobacterales bacterium]